MSIINHIRDTAKKAKKRIVLPRSSDERVIKAAEFLRDNEICDVILLTNEGVDKYPENIEVIDCQSSENLAAYAKHYYERRKHKGTTIEQASETVKDPLYFAMAMVALGHADGCVAGSVATTGDVLRAALQVVGLSKDSNVVSSSFIMSFPDGKVFTYGDCAVVPYPDEQQLATIAIDTAKTHKILVGEEPKVALLSFSTKGSSKYETIQNVTNALEIAQNKSPELLIDGELQFDTAFVEEIGRVKAPDSKVAGQANVFIFPNLDAGNIAYKITERLAGATATGPVIQGLDKPVMDLSRGCSWEDIVNTASVCALMSNMG